MALYDDAATPAELYRMETLSVARQSKWRTEHPPPEPTGGLIVDA